MGVVQNFWTDAQETLLREMWAEGATTSTIANTLGTTRNAVSGKIDRMGLPGRQTKARRLDPVPLREVVETPWSIDDIVDEPEEPLIELPAPSGPTLFTVGHFACRYPLWGEATPSVDTALVCGKPKVQGAYCKTHAALTYYSPKKRERRDA